jgi:nitrite reductase/ring-hydroxylating ferredoxin subunit
MIGISVVVCRAGGKLHAYRNSCPVCGEPFDGGFFNDDQIMCGVGHAFDVLEEETETVDESARLQRLPLQAENGGWRLELVPERSGSR